MVVGGGVVASGERVVDDQPALDGGAQFVVLAAFGVVEEAAEHTAELVGDPSVGVGFGDRGDVGDRHPGLEQ